MKALITGGAGFIGSNLAAHLLKKGWSVTVFDNLSRRGVKKNLDWLKSRSNKKLEVLVKDIRDFAAIKKASLKVEVIYHLAAQVAVTTSVLNPREDFEINAQGTLNVLEAARYAGHKPIIIYASTNKVYGAMADKEIKENSNRYLYSKLKNGVDEKCLLDFHSPYGCSKGAADQYVQDYHRIYDMPTVVFRQSCIYGPRQMGMEDQGWAAHFAISGFFERPITIYGDGKQVRDLLHISDLIGAYELAIKNIKTSSGKVYNIGGGLKHIFSIIECINFLEGILGKKIKIMSGDWRSGDQKVYFSNNSKLKKELSWDLKICHKEGLKQLVKWIKENKELFE
ncbi:MAG: CDP-paratose 2-epimerase [Candidatus Levybacteria bacterium RIFCSPHIGHO2_02_FULL_39_36]|nr:MAG: CDP-paratose 2-epimerase [Candidatus Levybacteria bacterium RIFCSPHIGHO2_02_FULL_39_36]OGH45599.1 MAG: CDP-paratose 2-epimerase [Candidatus Levybacteria bacterium RIFCSPLOWO2_02_FULL_39_26]